MREGGSLISQAHQLAGRAFARVLRARGIGEYSPAQGRILYELWKEDGIPQGELARRTKLDKSSLAQSLERMEAEGLVRREKVEGDGRMRAVFCGEGMKAMNRAYAEASREMIDLFYAGLPKARIDQFESTLRAIIANLEEAENQADAVKE